jgi:hypothetical protein
LAVRSPGNEASHGVQPEPAAHGMCACTTTRRQPLVVLRHTAGPGHNVPVRAHRYMSSSWGQCVASISRAAIHPIIGLCKCVRTRRGHKAPRSTDLDDGDGALAQASRQGLQTHVSPLSRQLLLPLLLLLLLLLPPPPRPSVGASSQAYTHGPPVRASRTLLHFHFTCSTASPPLPACAADGRFLRLGHPDGRSPQAALYQRQTWPGIIKA